MSLHSEDYNELVTNEIRETVGLYHPIKASLFEVLLRRKMSIKKMVPNPDDEFSVSEVGPNYEIVNNYGNEFRLNERYGYRIMEPIMVEKLSSGEYMILNGHHRWLAAQRYRMKRVPVRVVNVITEEEILKTIKASKRTMCVALDLDEVVIQEGSEKEHKSYFNLLFRDAFSKNVCLLINELHSRGYDVWVYTAQPHPVELIQFLFYVHDSKVDGIVRYKLGRHNKPKALQKAFAQKYRYSITVMKNNVIWHDRGTRDFENIEINTEKLGWAAAVSKIILDKTKEREEKAAEAAEAEAAAKAEAEAADVSVASGAEADGSVAEAGAGVASGAEADAVGVKAE